ncbi:MAG: hypothetical protein ABIO49_10675 [Dokdonella sp.]
MKGRTANDPSWNPDLDFCGFPLARSALDQAIASIPELDANSCPPGATTSEVEALGKALRTDASDKAILDFSESVCIWGGGQGRRVWGNLRKRNSSRLAELLRAWLRNMDPAATYASAIAGGTTIDGLGVSFASKHLRMLDPTRFAVLDSVLSEKLGFALNSNGYALFMRNLCEFKQRIGFEQNIATLEYGIYELVQQAVRQRR